VFLPQQFKVFHKAGKIFKDLALRSAAGTPSCAIVFGSSTAGGAYQPGLILSITLLISGMSDYTIFVKDQAQVFLGGPPLVKMATGEIVDSETLGGAEMHSSKSGLSDTLASDEFTGILAARRWLRSINPPSIISARQRALEPKYDIDDLLGLVGTDIRKGVMPMGEIIARIVDASRFEIFKPLYGKNMLCCWAYIHGIDP
jgi:acetyl-CoA carboxylase carboxyltransferase component